MYSKLNCLATLKVYFSLNELTNQSQQLSLEMKSFNSINFHDIAIKDIFFFRNLKCLYCFEFLAYFSFKDIL